MSRLPGVVRSAGSLPAWSSAARWAARVTGALLAGMVLLFVFGEGPPPLFRLPLSEVLMLLSGLVCLAGFVLIWIRESIGGVVALSGIVAFYGVNYAASGHFPVGWALPMFFVPGALAVVAAILGRLARRPQSR
jgi:hypothetical protein